MAWRRKVKQSEQYRHDRRTWEGQSGEGFIRSLEACVKRVETIRGSNESGVECLQKKTFQSTIEHVEHYREVWDKHAVAVDFDKRKTIKVRGGTLLHVACAVGQPCVIDFLVKHGWDWTAKDEKGQTPRNVLYRHPNMLTEEAWNEWVSSFVERNVEPTVNQKVAAVKLNVLK